ncbi:hypothetical protein BUALT_Bualt09G0082200 [Buddleja alternifolia]|uniref:Carbonic anhydrase n=1 Tax=Buddleja alternifolia TaxID=168488 RepID=A0AAV6X251_9LAMI|nr:hypothetical protein BUALT_Bualt09G0082200 [Buddleja alternifolia]
MAEASCENESTSNRSTMQLLLSISMASSLRMCCFYELYLYSYGEIRNCEDRDILRGSKAEENERVLNIVDSGLAVATTLVARVSFSTLYSQQCGRPVGLVLAVIPRSPRYSMVILYIHVAATGGSPPPRFYRRVISLLQIQFGVQNFPIIEDEREFDYGKKSERGPRQWGKIKKEWSACNNGNLQSPIDMSNERVRIISRPEKRNYRTANATVRNRGHDIQIHFYGNAGSIKINGTHYFLRYAHWHSPSEHTVNGRRYDMELHMVHVSTDPNVTNSIAVIGVFYKIGKPDRFLSKLMPNISSLIDKNDEEITLGMVNPRRIKVRTKNYYRYMGSLTIPPCTEGVIWTLNKKVKTVSREQVKLLREAVHDSAEENARPLQPKNSRDVYLYGPVTTI